MATLREIKNRIDSVKSTQQITKAMKMVAAAKLRKSQNNLLEMRPYSNNLFRITSRLAQIPANKKHRFFAKSTSKKTLFVLITSDRGLCGSFNTNLIKTATEEMNNYPGKSQLVTLGRKGFEFFTRRNYPVAGKYIDFFNKVSTADANKITRYIVDLYVQKKFGKIFIIYNEFQSIIHQNIVVKQFLPVVPSAVTEEEQDYQIFEPHPQMMLDELIPKALVYSMNLILLESYCAEQGARMTAMETASDNAKDMIKSLVLFYNKARQAAITNELNEIVSGAEALRG
jgi:F-type H+-transporting ATPase subunit gamma